MQAITVKYLPATNYRPSRYKAEAQAGSVTLAYDYSLNSDENAVRAAKALADKLEWDYGKWIGGETKDDSWAFVCSSTVSPFFEVEIQEK